MSGADDRAREAKAALRRLARETAPFAASATARATTPVAAEADDGAERWGRRIGRGLGLIAAVFLAYQLGAQRGWW